MSKLCRSLLFVTVLAAMGSIARADDGVILVAVGKTIERTMESLKADNYAYGPKQNVDASTGETQVFLPYGSNPGLYHGTILGYCTDAKDDHVAEFFSKNSNARTALTYKLKFDKPVGAFRLKIGKAELALKDTSVGGVEYSVDGKEWKTLKEYKAGAPYNIEPFVAADTKADGLNTQELYLRIYTRNAADPQAPSGPEEYLKLRMTGVPAWGGSGFFGNCPQIWVKPVS